MNRVIALGFFDGVHLGHGALLSRTAQLARASGCSAAALTFDRSPGKDGRLLTSVDDRIRLIRGLYGVDEVFVSATTARPIWSAATTTASASGARATPKSSPPGARSAVSAAT